MGRSEKERIITSVIIIVFLSILSGNYKFINARTTVTEPVPAVDKFVFNAIITDIDNDNRDGVTRISCRISGTAHTSNRIDAIELHCNDNILEATDIDGIDFRRYYQLEEDGKIEVEIDFPKINEFPVDSRMIFKTVRGDYEYIINSPTNKGK